MSQLSLFSAELMPPSAGDISGLLAGHGQAVRQERRARVSIVVQSQWRAEQIMAAIASTGLRAELAAAHEGGRPKGFVVRTLPGEELIPLARTWTKGAVKAVPHGWTPNGRELRLWALASGQNVLGHYQLGLDPHAPETFEPLAAALSRLGIAPMLIGARAGGPALRITGRKRLLRLVEALGEEPPGARAEHCWPTL
jgi:hypothetical protein